MTIDQSGAGAPLRVLRVITRLNIGGPSIQAITLCDHLAARRFETVLVHGRLGNGEGDMGYLLSPSVAACRAHHVAALRRPIAPLHDMLALTRLLDILRDWRPHIVHTHMAKAGTLGRIATAIYNATAGRKTPARVVHTYHGHVLEGYFGPARAHMFLTVERALARMTDRIIAISPTIRRELVDDQRIGRPEQYRIIPLGFDLTALASIDDRTRVNARGALAIPPGAHVVSTVGRLTAIKQHALFLEAARVIADGDPSAVFVVAGDGELRAELERVARELGLTDRTRFLGWRRDLATIYGSTDVFLLTSRNEGTPVALIESLAAGVPAVSTDVGGVRDVIDSADVGLLAPFGDARQLAEHVLALLRDPARCRNMGARGRLAVLAKYQIDRLVDDIASLYRELLA